MNRLEIRLRQRHPLSPQHADQLGSDPGDVILHYFRLRRRKQAPVLPKRRLRFRSGQHRLDFAKQFVGVLGAGKQMKFVRGIQFRRPAF